MKNLTIIPTLQQSDLLEKLMEDTEIKTATKALMYAAEFYVNKKPELEETIKKLRLQYDEFREQYRILAYHLEHQINAQDAIRSIIFPHTDKSDKNKKSSKKNQQIIKCPICLDTFYKDNLKEDIINHKFIICPNCEEEILCYKCETLLDKDGNCSKCD